MDLIHQIPEFAELRPFLLRDLDAEFGFDLGHEVDEGHRIDRGVGVDV